MTYKTARVKVISNFVNWKEAEEYDVDENTSTRELITTVLHRHGMLSRDPNLFYLTLEGRGQDSAGWSVNLSDEALVLGARDSKKDGHFAMHMRQGGLVKIYDESIMPGSYYKSLFISKKTISREVIALLLASYGKSESPDNFVLVEQTSKGKEVRQLKSSEFPLLVDQASPQTTLHLKRIKTVREKKSSLSRSQTISSAQDLQSRSGVSREATVVRLRESFRRLQRLRADQNDLDLDASTATPRVSNKFALSEESLDTTGASGGSPRKSGINSTLGKISKKLSSLTNIRTYASEKANNGSPPRSSNAEDSLLRRSTRSSHYTSQQHSAADLLARVGLPGGSPRSSKRYSFPPASADLDAADEEPSTGLTALSGSPRSARRHQPPGGALDDISGSPRSARRHQTGLDGLGGSPRTERRRQAADTAANATLGSPRSPRRHLPVSDTSPEAPVDSSPGAGSDDIAHVTAAAINHAFSSPRSERRPLPKSFSTYSTSTTANTAAAAAAGVPDPLGLSPRAQRRHRSFNSHSVYTSARRDVGAGALSARDPPSSARAPAADGSMSARAARDVTTELPSYAASSNRLPIRATGENGATGASVRRQLPQPPPTGGHVGSTVAADNATLAEIESRRRLLALEAQRRLRQMSVATGSGGSSARHSLRGVGGHHLRYYPYDDIPSSARSRTGVSGYTSSSARPLATSPSRLQAKTRRERSAGAAVGADDEGGSREELRLPLRSLLDSDDKDEEAEEADEEALPTTRRVEVNSSSSSSGRRGSPRKASAASVISTASQTEESSGPSQVAPAAKFRKVSSHPSLFDVVEQCEVFTLRLTRDSMWERFGLRCFEAIFTPNSGSDEGSGLSGGASGAGGVAGGRQAPGGRRPVLGRTSGAFQAVNAQALASIRSVIAVDTLEPDSAVGSFSSSNTSLAGPLQEGDYLLEVNGISVLSSTPQQVESLINSFLTVEITGARARGRIQRPTTSASSTDGTQEETANSDLERQLATLRSKYSQLKLETRKNEQLIAELRDAVSKKVRVRVGHGAADIGRVGPSANSFRAIRSGYSEEVVSTV